MKTKYIFLILCFLGIAMGSCKDDSASNPTFADDELYIYTDMLESVSAIKAPSRNSLSWFLRQTAACPSSGCWTVK